jgi:hypothetical protein
LPPKHALKSCMSVSSILRRCRQQGRLAVSDDARNHAYEGVCRRP